MAGRTYSYYLCKILIYSVNSQFIDHVPYLIKEEVCCQYEKRRLRIINSSPLRKVENFVNKL